MKALRIIFLLQLFISSTGFAQQPYFLFDRITTHDGLPSDNTIRIIQDKQGLIWIATSEGLCRYDGYHVTTFRYNPSQAHSLVNNYIYDLSEDENGNIWIATAGGWCELLFNTQTFLNANDFKNFHGNPPCFIPGKILADQHHRVFMGSSGGSCILNLQDSSFEQFKFATRDTIPLSGLISIYQDKDGLVWLMFQNTSRVYDPSKNEFYSPLNNPYGYPLITGMATLLKTERTVWLGKWGAGLFVCDMRRHIMRQVGKDTTGLKDIIADMQPKKMITDRQGNLWLLLNDKGIYYMDFVHDNFQLITNDPGDPNTIPSQVLSDIMSDRNGNIWIATNEGIARWNNDREIFQLLPYTGYIPRNFIPAANDKFDIDGILENNNEVWMSVSTSGLIVANNNDSSPCRHIQIDSGNRASAMNRIINNIFKDRNENIWVATQEGYATYDRKRDCLVPHFLYRHDVSGNPFYQVMMMFQDKDGVIWFASKKGLGKLTPSSDDVHWLSLPVAHKTGVPFFIQKIIPQNDSIIWLATEGGLFSFNKKTERFARYSSDNLGKAWSVFDDCVDALFVSDTIMMIASQFEGVIKFNPKIKSFRVYSTNDGLSSNNIRNLFADSYGGLWITTLNGLSRLDLKAGTFSRYDYSNGIKNPVFENATTFYPETDRSVLLLDGAYVLRFDPSQFVHGASVPGVAFTSFEKFDEPVFYDKPLNDLDKIHLNYSDRFFTIRFSTLNFQNTSRTQYAYMMDGLDGHWHMITTPYVSYSNLRGGTYTLHIKASLDGNVWSREKRLAIVVTPPFWQAWWFYAICGSVAFGIALLFYRVRIDRLKRELYLRTKIARDLHDDVGSTLSSLHMVSALATKKVEEDPAKTKELLEKITESSERMTGNMQDIVWAVNPLNDSFAEIIARMQKFASQMLELKNIDLIFFADEKIKSLKVPLEYRSDLFMIFKEAVNNLAKYSHAKTAWISLIKNHSAYILEIKDDGHGFNVQRTSEGNGLRNMQERANNLHGNLTVWSEPGSGTKIILEFNA